MIENKESQQAISPSEALKLLVDGNNRFVENMRLNPDLNRDVELTSRGQFPFAVILGCIDSRVSSEIVFDQGIGDVFSVRVAGNIVNEDVLGSLEYSCKVVGSKLIMVLGHTNCGAVKAAYEGVEMGNITALLKKIQPAIDGAIGEGKAKIEVAIIKNIENSINQIRKNSPVLAGMEGSEDIKIVGAVYNVETGVVSFI